MSISVIIPTYNRANFLTKAIESVLNQTLQPNEIIVIDDGSDDNTKEIIEAYPNIKYIYQDNSGVSSARNLGIKNAKSKWILFLDSDDFWHKDKLQIQVDYHNNNQDIYISHTDETWIRDNRVVNKPKKYKKEGGYLFYKSLTHTNIGTSTIMIKKSLFDEIGLYDESLVACEDFDLFLRVSKKYNFGYIDKQLTTKVAGDHNQLSFTTPIMDEYRVDSLLKHIDNDKVAKVIIQKARIIYDGAIKNKNKRLISKYLRHIL